jgi:hypothetical protein
LALLKNGQLVDRETGSSWDVRQGRATEGELLNEVLQSIPSSSAFDWAWLDFYPETTFSVGIND